MVETVVSGRSNVKITLQEKKKVGTALPLWPKFMEQNRPYQTISNGEYSELFVNSTCPAWTLDHISYILLSSGNIFTKDGKDKIVWNTEKRLLDQKDWIILME